MTPERLRQRIHIVRLSAADARHRSDHLKCFEDLILANEQMYPHIDKWYRSKVLPGLANRERAGFVAYVGDRPAISAVVKKAGRSKICHLRLNEVLRDCNVGEVLFSLMLLEIRDFAEEVHFTLPESVWRENGHFFSSFGFETSQVSEKQYRLFDSELYCSAPFERVWACTLEKIPKLSTLYSFGGIAPDTHLVLSLSPTNAERILTGKKRVEIRRKFSTRWSGHRMNLYSAAPEMSLVGQATISRVVRGSPEAIWDSFGPEIGCTFAEFSDYVKGAADVYAIELQDVSRYRAPITLSQLCHLLREQLTPPQSYFTLEHNTSWAKAVSLAAYLHASFKSVLRPNGLEEPQIVNGEPTMIQGSLRF